MSSGCCGRCCGLACGDCETHLTADCTCPRIPTQTSARVDGETSIVCVSELCPYCGSEPCESPYLHNFRAYPVQQATHFLIGILIGLLLTTGWAPAAFGLIAFVVARQISEFVKLHDDVQIDLAVYIAGVLVGIGATVAPAWLAKW